jgi:FkbM family methyltransferase
LKPCANGNSGDASHYKSQSGEDSRAETGYFKGLCGGTYMELGALDGIRYSNTYMFKHDLNWKGVLIEADPESFAELQQNRADGEIAVEHMAVCSSQMMVHWVSGGDAAVRGIWEFMSPEFRTQWHPGLVDITPSELSNQPGVTDVPCNTLMSVLENNNVSHIDLLSLDVEGAEVKVLQSVDFSRVSFGLLIIETNDQAAEMKAVLEPHGYKHVETFDRSEYFVNANFSDWYGHNPEPAEHP